MRQLGTISTEDHARRIIDFLLTQGIAAVGEQEEGGFAIWVRDEQHLDQARAEFAKFKAAPDEPQYREAQRDAHALRVRQLEKLKAAQKNLHTGDRAVHIPLRQRAPLTLALIVLCCTVALLSNFGKKLDSIVGQLTFAELRFDDAGNAYFPINGWESIQAGQVWRLMTPALIHFGMWHLFFNSYWVYRLGSMIEQRYGTWRFALLCIATEVISNCCEHLVSGYLLFGGMSGVCYGLFAFVWIKSWFDPWSKLFLSNETVVVMLGWLVLCFLPQFQDALGTKVANYAHLSGLIVGVVIGFATPRSVRPKQ